MDALQRDALASLRLTWAPTSDDLWRPQAATHVRGLNEHAVDDVMAAFGDAQRVVNELRTFLGMPVIRLRPRHAALTTRQLEVLTLLCLGKPNKVIARDLNLSENTVRVHVAAIFVQLRVNSRSTALLMAQRLGLLNAAPLASPVA